MLAEGDMDVKRNITGHTIIIADMAGQALKEPGMLSASVS